MFLLLVSVESAGKNRDIWSHDYQRESVCCRDIFSLCCCDSRQHCYGAQWCVTEVENAGANGVKVEEILKRSRHGAQLWKDAGGTEMKEKIGMK